MRQYYYSHHLFFCQNVREGDRKSCNADGEAERLRQYAKDRISEWGLKKPGGVRVNQAGCLGRCSDGPLLVVYPEGVWYQYHSEEDIDEILFEHVMNGEIVERLVLPNE
jgi:(2Fe-2S) ferredoxin